MRQGRRGPRPPASAPLFASTMRTPLAVRFVSFAALCALTACVTETDGRRPQRSAQDAPAQGASGAGQGDAARSPWIAPSPALAQQIETHSNAVRAGRDLDVFAREAEWFGGVGEPAYPALLELARDKDTRVASFGLATISAQRDARLLEPLKAAVPAPASGPLRLEYARAVLALGDWSHLDVLIDALESDDVRVRGGALKALRTATGESHGFHPQAEPAQRAESVASWRAWWALRSADPNLRPVTR